MKVDFIGIGAARCGTSWISNCLEEHPDIHIPSVKEIHYFDDDNQLKKGLNYYLDFFKNNPGKKCQGEFTPRYMLYRSSLEEIARIFPEIKILISLRNPVDRAYSQYIYFRFNKKKEYERNFEKALTGYFMEDYLDKSRYANQISTVYKIFNKNNVHITFYSDIQNDPQKAIQDIYSFLGVDNQFKPGMLRSIINKSSNYPVYIPKVWASLVQAVEDSEGRKINGKIIRNQYFHNEVLKYIFSSKNTRNIVKLGNKFIDNFYKKTAQGDNELFIDDEVKKRIYLEHFKDDINELERILEKDLSNWKY